MNWNKAPPSPAFPCSWRIPEALWSPLPFMASPDPAGQLGGVLADSPVPLPTIRGHANAILQFP